MIIFQATTQAHYPDPARQIRTSTYTGSGRTLSRGGLARDDSYDAARLGGAFTRRDNSFLLRPTRVLPSGVNREGYVDSVPKGGYVGATSQRRRVDVGLGRQRLNNNNYDNNNNNMRYNAGRLVQDVVYNPRRVGGLNCGLGEECLRDGSGRLRCRLATARSHGLSSMWSHFSECSLFTREDELALFNRCFSSQGKRYAVLRNGTCQYLSLKTSVLACRPDDASAIFRTTAECRRKCGL
ncbi:hypothetical protein ACOMHN_025787 [Nucella lapillus]